MNISPVNSTFIIFVAIYICSWPSCTLTTIGYSSCKMPHFIGLKLTYYWIEEHARNIHLRPTRAKLDIYWTWWGLFASKNRLIQISGNSEQLSRGYGPEVIRPLVESIPVSILGTSSMILLIQCIWHAKWNSFEHFHSPLRVFELTLPSIVLKYLSKTLWL